MKKDIVKSEEVIGLLVENFKGESLGEIEAVIVNKNDGIVEYIILSGQRLADITKQLFALPWYFFNYNADSGKYRVNLDKEILENSPPFYNYGSKNQDDFYLLIDTYYRSHLFNI